MPKPYPEAKYDNLHVFTALDVQDVRIKLAQKFAHVLAVLQ